MRHVAAALLLDRVVRAGLSPRPDPFMWHVLTYGIYRDLNMPKNYNPTYDTDGSWRAEIIENEMHRSTYHFYHSLSRLTCYLLDDQSSKEIFESTRWHLEWAPVQTGARASDYTKWLQRILDVYGVDKNPDEDVRDLSHRARKLDASSCESVGYNTNK